VSVSLGKGKINIPTGPVVAALDYTGSIVVTASNEDRAAAQAYNNYVGSKNIWCAGWSAGTSVGGITNVYGAGEWTQIQLPAAQYVTKYRMWIVNANELPIEWTVQGSNDGVTYTQIDSKDILFTIDDKPVTTAEFLRVYNKNLDLITDESQKDIDNYLQLYIDYKLKVSEAYEKKYDKKESYIFELNKYSAQLAANYLFDKESQDSLLIEAYDRTATEIKASHILIRIDENDLDTLDVYNKLVSYREEFLKNKLEYLIKKYHDGKNTFVEDLGYFSAFKMIYSFESIAYNTIIGDISMPFRTRFGYHILKVDDKRKSLGEVTVGHLMLLKKNNDSKVKINALYDSIAKGGNFESFAKKYSRWIL
jgi:parvulin-like peptidyl-prolyl isomerase